jgi:hypothetical protein
MRELKIDEKEKSYTIHLYTHKFFLLIMMLMSSQSIFVYVCNKYIDIFFSRKVLCVYLNRLFENK